MSQPPPVPPPPPAPKKSRTGCWIALIVVALCGVVFVGIMAAIALPAYNDYLTRSKATLAMTQVFPLKIEVASFHAQHQRCPVIGDEGFDDPANAQWLTDVDVSIGPGVSGACTIDARLRVEDKALRGKTLRFEYDADQGTWHCSSDIERRYLPSDCRD